MMNDYQNVVYNEAANTIHNSIQIGYNLSEIKSHMKIGNIIIHNTKHFNLFHRIMWKLFFGFNIENLKDINK